MAKEIDSTEIQDRLVYLIKHLGTNMNAFAKEVDVSSAVIMNICKGRRSKPSFDVIKKIFTRFPELNARWFILGEGEIMNEDFKSISTETKSEREQQLEIQINRLIETVHNLSKGD